MVSVLKRLLGKALPYRRRVSYYESQTFMRHAVESVGFVDLIRFSDDELQQVIAANKNPRWVAAARREIETRRDIRQKLGVGHAGPSKLSGHDGLAMR